MIPTIITTVAKTKAFHYAFFLTLFSVFVAFCFLNPTWTILGLHEPQNPAVKVDFTQPVDSIFYVRNAERGYVWSINEPTSLWFHPLLAWSINLLPSFISANYRLWILSLISTFGSTIVVYYYTREISTINIKASSILFIPLLPGGLGIATGNAEIPCLFFTSLLAISVIRSWDWYSPLLLGGLAILVKPNALYMVFFLAVFFINGLLHKDKKVLVNSLLGIAGILGVWLLWILYVDLNSGQLGVYWRVREMGGLPLDEGVLSFFKRTSKSFSLPNSSMSLSFVSAFTVPLVDMWLLRILPLKNETHRLSIFAGLFAMLLLAWLTNNPNKIVVYATTFPGHIAVGLIFLAQAFSCKQQDNVPEKIIRYLAAISYLIFCLLMVIFYVIGTPLEWYY